MPVERRYDSFRMADCVRFVVGEVKMAWVSRRSTSVFGGPYRSFRAPHCVYSSTLFKERATEVNESQTFNKDERGIILTLCMPTDAPQ
jgi:hypothetical protein